MCTLQVKHNLQVEYNFLSEEPSFIQVIHKLQVNECIYKLVYLQVTSSYIYKLQVHASTSNKLMHYKLQANELTSNKLVNLQVTS
jgi:hypothetical protein